MSVLSTSLRATFIGVFMTFACHAQIQLGQGLPDAEAGVVTSGYNDIQIPGDNGTRFNATETLDNPVSFSYRFRLGYRHNDKHNVFLLFAPLSLKYKGQFDEQIQFQEQLFAANRDVQVQYVFNSYRLTYRYDFVVTDKWRVGAGITGKIRDAVVEVSQDTLEVRKTNIGFVPLLNFYAYVRPYDKIGFSFDGDGLASPQGRAFDFLLAAHYHFSPKWSLRLGYRFLEGGADNDEVYNFTLLHYAVAGISYNFYAPR